MNNSKSKAYKSKLIESLIHEIGSEEQKSTDRKMMLAAKIYDAMKAKGIKNGHLAAMLRKKPSEITKWLSGTHNFTVETLWNIGDALGIEIINLSMSTPRGVKGKRFETRARLEISRP